MGFQKGNQLGKLSKRGQSKLSIEMKSYLEGVTDGMIRSIDFDKLDDFDKLQYLKIFLPYVMPKKKELDISTDTHNEPLFEIVLESD